MTSNSEIKADSSSIAAKIELLQTKVDEAIKKARGNRRDNSRKASLIKLAATFCSATATILLGLKVPNLESQF
jgi:hypothetical protein